MKKSGELKVAQGLFCLNGAIWLLLSVVSVVRLVTRDAVETWMFWVFGIIAVLMVGNASAMILAGWLLARRQKQIYIFALLLLLVNIVLSFTDQFGLLDLLTVLLDIAILLLLLVKARSFLPPTAE